MRLLLSLKIHNKCSLICPTRLCSRSSSSKPPSVSSFTEETPEETTVRTPKRPVSYMPDHLPYPHIRPRNALRVYWKVKEVVDMNPLPPTPSQLSEWSETAEYPDIHDETEPGKNKRVRMEWYDCLKRLPTASEKLYEISKHYSHLSIKLSNISPLYNSLPMQQFITRTHLVSNSIPQSDQSQDHLDENKLVGRVKDAVLNAIAVHLFQTDVETSSHLNYRAIRVAKHFTNFDQVRQENLIQDITSLLRRMLVNEAPHLFDSQVDILPFVGSTWWHKGLPAPFIKKYWFKNETVDQQFHYKAHHALQIRTDKPIPEVVPMDDSLCTTSDIPQFPFNPATLGYPHFRHNHISLSGFLPDCSDGFNFPHTIFLTRQELIKRDLDNQKNNSDHQQVLDGMAIMSAFSWLNSMANNNGFTVYHELTYPLVTNVIITDGQKWSFYVYQLNTHSFHSDVDMDNRRNVCWSSGEMKLFDEYKDGEFIGLNETVLANIIKFVVKKPVDQLNYNPFPYLGQDIRNEEDIEEQTTHMKRKFANFFDPYLKMRQRVYPWEKLVKKHHLAPPQPHLRSRPVIKLRYPPFFTK